MRTPILLGVAIAVAALTPANAVCNVSGIWYASGGTWPFSMTLEANESCRSTYSGLSNTVILAFKNLYLLEAPSHGVVSMQQGGYVVYKPHNNFRGSDKFLTEVCVSTTRADHVCSQIQYDVTVR